MIGFLVFGLVVGFLARLVVPGRQHLTLRMTLLLGLLGSVVGGVVANALGTGDLFERNVIGSLVAIAAAVVLIILGERVGWLARHRSKEADQAAVLAACCACGGGRLARSMQ